jgi:hypothetical protein
MWGILVHADLDAPRSVLNGLHALPPAVKYSDKQPRINMTGTRQPSSFSLKIALDGARGGCHVSFVARAIDANDMCDDRGGKFWLVGSF